MRTFTQLVVLSLLVIGFQYQTASAQSCTCPNGNNGNGPFISGALNTPTVACYEDLLALINGPLGDPMTVAAFDIVDGFVPVCIVSAAPVNNCVGAFMILVDAEDSEGNCASNGPFAVNVIIQDLILPVITCPSDVMIQCEESLDPIINGNLGEATAIENCTEPVVIASADITINADPCATVIERTWSATDCGGSATCVQTITVTDNQAPTFTVPADMDITVDAMCVFDADISVTGDVSDELDNCDPTVEATFSDVTTMGSCDGETVITRTWTSTDDCGNSNVQTQVITVLDEIPPVISGCPSDITVECDALPSINDEMVTYVDNCDPTIIGIPGDEQIIADPNNPFPCTEEILLLRTWEASDDCGNTASCTQLVLVIDTTDPIITFCPGDATVNCEDDNSSFSLGFALATDNCSSNVDIQESDITAYNGCNYDFVITRTWVATDECNNSTSCVQTITVEDNAPPAVVFCPADIVIECDQDTSALALGFAEGDDLCSGMSGMFWANVITPGACTHSYTITRTFTLTDECGNTNQCTQVIQVEDTTPPDPSCPSDETVECDAIPMAVDPGVTDLCDPTVDVSLSEMTDLTGCGNYTGTITRTWTFTDDCGNTDVCVQIITVEDNTAPTWDQAMPGDVVVNCQSVPTPPAIITADDGCDNTVDVTFVEDNMQGVDPTQCDYYTYSIIRTWTATDDCGNETIHTQTITVQDVTDPGFTDPIDILAASQLGCGDENDLSLTGFPTLITDNCAPAEADGSAGYTTGDLSWVTPNGYTISFSDIQELPWPECSLSGNGLHHRKYRVQRTWTVEDPCGNSTSLIQLITIIDDTPPVIVCPPDVVVECSDDLSSNGQGVATATDDCDDPMEITITELDNIIAGLCTGESVIERTWTAEDICGNTSSCLQTITTEDTTPPSVVCPANTVAECSDDLTPTGQGAATGMDNCDLAPTISSLDTPTAGPCAETYTITRTWTVEDDCGNSTSCDQTIEVQDTNAPVFDQAMPTDVTVNCQSVPTPPAMITATDACDPLADISYTEVSTQGVDPTMCTYYNYTLTRTWVAVDNCGNEETHTQTITVQDVTGPAFTAPADLVAADQLSCGDEEDLSLTGFPTDIMDNCAPTEPDGSDGYTVGATSWTTANGYLISFVDVEAQPFPECSLSGNGLHKRKYQIQRTWTIEDPCGNATTALQTINIIDDTPPVVVCPADIVIECDDEIDPAINLSLGEASATDNCDDVIEIDIDYADTPGPGSCPGESVITRTWTATDVCGNSASCDQILTLEDTTPPVWDTAPADDAVECGPGDAAAFSAWLTSYAGAAASDNCSNVTLSSNGLTPTPGCGNTVTYSLNVRATDECGLFIENTVTFTIEDTTPPVITCAPDVVVECTDPTDPANTGMSTATDNCGMTTITSTEFTTPGACVAEYTISRTWTAEDECGLTSSCTQTITVDDSTVPDITCPGNTAVECDGDFTSGANGMATATDNCDPAPMIAESDNILPGGCTDAYTIERTWTATDECGNASSCVQLITVEDTTDPVITCAPNVVVECDEPTDPANTGSSTATDNCDMDVTMTYVDGSAPGGCPQEETITRTWTATDNCGNETTCDQTIEVEDSTPPVFTTSPVDETIECDLATNGADFTAWLMSYAGAAADDNCGMVTLSAVGLTPSPQCGNTIIYSVTIRATDECGNTTDEPATFTIIDNTAPAWDDPMPVDATVECDAIPVADVFTASDDCDNMVDVTYNETSAPGACPQEQTLTRTWTAEDDCGNAITHVQTITVEDSSSPSFTTPPSILAASQLSCGDENDLSLTGFPTAITDNCANAEANGNSGYTMGDVSWTTANGYLISFTTVLTAPQPWAECSLSGNGLHNRKFHYTRTWTVADPCGNTTTGVQTITLIDDTPPVWDQVMPVDVTVECDAIPVAPVGGVDLTATDNCDDAIDITYTDGEQITPGLCTGEYTITRTWTAEDICGNAVTHTQTITVEDTTPPSFSVPVDITIQTDASCMYNADPSITGDVTDETDNCSGPIQATYADATGPGACIGQIILTRTWTLTDDCGLKLTQTQIITIEDDLDPVLVNCPGNTTISCLDPIPAAPVVTAMDNCDPMPVVSGPVEVSGQTNDGSCTDHSYTISRVWTATDGCGNSTSCEQVITVEDVIIPVITLTGPATVDLCVGDSYTDMGATALDDCFGDVSADIVVVNPVDVNTPGTYMVTYNVSDPCGNAAVEVIRTVIIHDYPRLETSINSVVVTSNNDGMDDLAPPMEVCNEAGNVFFDLYTDLNSVPGDIRVYQTRTLMNVTTPMCDNCAAPIGAFTGVSGTATLVDPTMDGTLVMRFRVWLDLNSNNTIDPGECAGDWVEYTFILKADVIMACANDTTVAACQDQATVDQAFADWLTTTTFTGGMNPVLSNDNSGAPNACGGVTVVTWTVTSDCEPDVTCSATFTVTEDDIEPTFTVPADIDIYSDANCAYDADPSITGDVTDEMDNCGGVLDATYSDVPANGSCEGEVVITRTWTLTDLCSNTTAQDQIITVRDTISPTFTVPDDITINADIDCMYDTDPVITGEVSDEADNCTTVLDATYTDDDQPGACAGQRIITRTWSLVDDCSNSLEQTQVITVIDAIEPELVGCPSDVTIACNDPLPVPPVVTATDNCDMGPVVTGPVSVSGQTNDGSCSDNTYDITLTWTATDACGNTATCAQVIAVQDLIIPVITLTGPDTVDLCVGDSYTDMGATALDDCFGDVSADIVVVNPVDVNTPGTYMVTYNVSDPCGNAAVEVIRTVIIHDYPRLETSINGVVVTSNNDGMDDIAPPVEVCNAPPGNILFDSFIDLNNVPGAVKAWQTVTTVNATTGMCNNCSAPLPAFTGAVGSTTLIDPSMDGSLVMRFRAWLDLNGNNTIDPGECAGDWIEYTFTIKAEVNLTCANDTTLAACQDQPTVDQAFADWLTTTTFTGGKNPVLTDDNTGAPYACGGSTVVTWTVTSDCEPDVTCTATFTVTEDDIDPVLTCPADLSAQCNISEQPAYVDLMEFETDGGSATDNCDVDPNTFTLFSEVSDNNSCPELITRTYTIEDLCGNTASCTQTITVDDTIEPTLDATPADLTVECDAVPVADVITGSDNCDQMVMVSFQEVQNNGLCADSYTLVRTWTAEDDCGNTVSHVQTITVEDTMMPDWDQAMPADETVECDAVPVVFGPVTASDNCDPAVDVTFGESQNPGNCPDNYTLTRTWTATDNCGNSTVYTQTITVQDTTDPTLLAGCPTDETIECDDPVPATAVVTAEDNCDPAPVVTLDEVTDLSGCGGYTGTITRTWTAEDACGNSSDICIQVITVEDTTVPTLLAGCPSDQTIECDDPVPAAAVVTAEDNCDPAPVVTLDEVTDLSGCGGYTGTITRIWTAEDACGNSTEICTQVITVQDTEIPAYNVGSPDITIYTLDDNASCPTPADISLVADLVNPIAFGQTPASFTVHGVTFDTPNGSATDNCTADGDLQLFVWSINDDFGGTADDCQRTIRVSYRLYDLCGNFRARSQDFIIIENTPPAIACPADLTIQCDEDQSPANTGSATVTDNCDLDPTIGHTEVVDLSGCGGYTGTITRTWTAEDNCTNVSTCTQIITVEDTTDPTLLAGCPTDETIECDDPVPAPAVVTAEDNCDPAPVVTLDEVTDLSGCGGYTGTITRTWTAEDACGNSSDICVQVITVEDTTDPTMLAGCPADQTIECDDPVPAAVVVTAEDNCDPAPVVTLDEVTDLSGCGGYTGTITRTWTAEDACGNSAEICTQVITVQDTEIPAYNVASPDITIYTLDDNATCPTPADISLVADQVNPIAFGQTPASFTVHGVTFDTPNGSATDNCTDENDLQLFVWNINNDFGGTADDCQRTIRVTYRLYDLCGNFRARSQDFIIIENTPPAITCPADLAIQCDEDQSPANTGSATATDNCDLDPTIDYTEVVDLSGCGGYTGTITRTWTAEDNCTNSSTCTQIITIEDTTAPTLLAGCPTDETIECSDPVPVAAVVTAEDNCDPAPVVTLDEVTDLSGCGGYTGTITRTWTAEDACGNSDVICIHVITVEDSTPPTFTVPADITIEKDVNCNYDADPVLTGDVLDEADNCSTGLEAQYTDAVNPGNCEGEEVITRTWTLTDDCGNDSIQTQVITAIDLITPTFPKPADVTIYTEDGATCPGMADISLVADQMNPIVSGNAPFNFTVHGLLQAGPTVYSDNCSTAPNLDLYVWSVNPDFGGNADECMRSIRVIYRVYDDCGNFQQRQQIFTILDNTDPTFTVPADITIYTDANCNYDADPSITGDVTDEDDNCSVGLIASYSDDVVPGNCTGEQIITRTWYLADNCGNDSIQIQTITVLDNVPPTFTVPADMTIEKDVNCDYDADPSITGDVIDEADNCSSGLDALYTDIVTAGSCEGEQIISRSWSLTDDCGNETIQTQTITAVDLILPIFPKPADHTISTEDGATCPGVADISLVADQNNPVASGNAPFVFTVHGLPFDGPTVYSDNCSTGPNLDLYVWSINSSFMGIGDDCERQIQVIFRVYDDCGNFQQRQQIFTIIENTPPDLSACTVPLDGTVECTGDAGNEQAAINWDMANITYLYGCASDNCTDITVTSDYDFANYIYACGLSGEITVVYTVTDECSNSTTTSATLTVVDNFGPDLTNCPNLDDVIECDGAVNNAATAALWNANILAVLEVCATEVCGDFTVSSDFDYANLVPTCGEAGTLTVNYTLEDECMNLSVFIATLTIEDTTPPTIDFCPGPVAINCEDSQDPMDTGGPATASDVCDANPVITWDDVIVPGSCPDSYVIERTWTATDDCNNATSCLQEITVIDEEKPVYNLGTPDVTLYTLEDNATCPGTADISLVVNQATPVATGHVTVPFTVHGVVFQTPNGNGTDNCTPDDELKLYVWAINEDFFNDADECHRTIEVLFRLYDRCGNFRNRTQAYTIIENTPPVITCPADVTIDCDDDPFDLNLTGEATATDNCDADPTVTFSDVNDLNGCSMTGTITRTWLAEDNCTNTSDCVQVITVQDVDPPLLINCVPEDLNAEFECDGLAGNEAAAIAWNAANIANLETCAFDVCGVIVVTSNYNFANLSDQCGETGSLIVTYTVTDECLNSTTITGTFTIIDTTVPDLSACNLSNLDATHECDGDAGNLAAANAWNAGNVTYLEGCVTDLCGSITVTHDYVYTNLTDGCGITGEVLVTYTLTDECNNSTTATGTFTVEDTTDPGWDSAMPVDVTVECDAVPAAFVATASDGCDTDVDIVYTEVGSDSICLDNYILTRTWTATDDCNNAITHTQSIQVVDTTVPDPLCQDREIFLDENGIATITPEEVDNGSTDNCDVMVDLALSKTVFDCDDEGPNPVTLTVTDNCGNSNTCMATVTVTDAMAPVALCQDVTVSLDANGQGSITPNDVDNGSYDNCGIASLVISQSQYNCTWLGVSVVTLTVTDIYNNVSTCTANVSVVDEIPPVAVCKNYFVELNGQGEAPITYFDIDGGSTDNCSIVDYQVVPNVVTCADLPMKNVTLTVTDPGGNKKSCIATVVISDNLPPIMACKDVTRFLNAQGDPITVTPQDIDSGSKDNCTIVTLNLNKTVFDCSDIGQNVVLLTAIDQSGNSNNCSATVTIVDAIPPVWTYMPGDITVNCIDVFDDNPEAADNCGGVNINWTDVQEIWPAGPPNSYLVRRTWTAFDASGNEISYEQVVYVLPGGELLVSCNPDVITQPTHFPIKVDWPVPTVDDICEGSVDMVQIGGPPPLSYFNPGSETLITYEHVDIYGTHYQCSFWVIVPTDGSGYIVVLNEVDCEDHSLTNCEVKDLPAPDNYSFEYIVNNMTPIQFDVESNGNFEMFADGSAHLTGSWTNLLNTCGWDMDIWLHRRRTHDGWVDAGGNISSFSGLGDPELWEFFEVDGSRSKMTGTGCYAGQNYNVRISPNFPKFGFQLGNGANTKTNAYGGWVIVAMTNASDQVVAQGIFSFELDCDPTNLIKDAAEVISLDGFNYPVVWSTGTTGPLLGDVPPGMYDVTVTDQGGMTNSSDFTLDLPKDCILYYENDCRPGNMTAGGLAKQTSTYQGAVASRAIDQNTDGDFANGSVTSTLAGFQNAWTLALANTLPIEKIRIWNRTDCCEDLLDPFYVFVSETPIPDNVFPEDLVFHPEILAYYHSGPLEDSYTFDVGQMGQYVRVQLAGSGRLMLAEVQVLVCQEDAIGLKDDGFTAPEEEEVKKVEVMDDVPTVAYWPNPANDYLEIDITQQHASPIGVTIVNMQGVEVYRAKLPADHLQHLHLDTGNWGPGIYFMTISSSNGARSLPLTIQH